MGYIDIHCHVLPGVDDGSQSMDESLEMLRIAQENGISDMIVTPQYKQGRVGTPREAIGRMIEEVGKYAQLSGINVKLHPGTEIYYNSSLEEKFESGWLATMNDTEYVLVEFSPMETYSYIRNAMDDVFSLGYKPILAHVERYQCMLAKLDNVKDLHDLGVLIQVNADSVAGTFGFKIKHFIKKLLKEQLVDFIGTDAHDEKRRKPELAKCAEVLRKTCDASYADAILFENAAQVLLVKGE
ncbi:MAG: protein-tyrosine-phosphatase [Lachnospiraceae bacterium]|nr:protein-tyrosine-phosphatase [Lachnospiraceae bacterium]